MIMICVVIPRLVALYYLKNYLDGAVYSATINFLFVVDLFKITALSYYRKGIKSIKKIRKAQK